MYKFVGFFILIMFTFVPYVDASDLSNDTSDLSQNNGDSSHNASDLSNFRDNYINQIDAIENVMQKTDDKQQLIKLSREKNKLAAHKRAYDKAIEFKSMPVARIYLQNIDYEADLPYIDIYKNAAAHYKIDWALLAAVHDIETNFSRHSTMVSSAGALGHMQFMPATWDYYGVDADGDGKADPFSLIDSIYSAANYLAATGAADGNIKKALFAYNRSTKYGLEVMAKADKYRQIGGVNND